MEEALPKLNVGFGDADAPALGVVPKLKGLDVPNEKSLEGAAGAAPEAAFEPKEKAAEAAGAAALVPKENEGDVPDVAGGGPDPDPMLKPPEPLGLLPKANPTGLDGPGVDGLADAPPNES